MNISRKITILLSLALLIALFVRSSYLYQFENSLNWGLTQWLVNYEGGFVRRGLIGQLLLYVHENHYIAVNKIIILVCMFLYLFLLLYLIALTKKDFPIEIILSPLLMGMPVLTEFFVRYDILGLIIFIFILRICFLNINFFTMFFLVNLIYIISILINETFLFYTFLAIFLIFLKKFTVKNNFYIGAFKSILFLLPSINVFFILVYINTD